MKELKPLLRDDASDFERQLLSAVRRERPSPQLQARMRGTLGLTGPVAWLGAARAALSTAAGKGALGLAVAGLVGGSLVASGLVTSEVAEPVVRAPEAYVAAGADTGVRATEVPAAEVPAAEVPAAEVPAAPRAEAPAAVAPEAEDPSSRQLREEILVLDQVRGALQRGSRAAALRELERYGQRFPEGILSREAAQLRKQARAKGPASGTR